MATQQKSERNDGNEQKMGGGGDVGSPVSNDAYNVIACLHEKLQGLEAIRKFSKDGQQQIWKKLSELDRQAVMQLIDELETMVKDGKLRGASSQGQQGQRPSAQS